MSLLASTLLGVGKAAAPVGQHAASAPGLFGAVLALLAVLALVVGLGWLLKRLPGSGFRPADGMKLVASLSVGAKERVVVVEVNGQQLLLGVTAGSINALHTLSEPLPPPAPVRVPDLKNLPNFAQLLQQRLRKDP
ncbi:flagellar biosynthetic protein FliO [Stenotrophomonas maltophilia]|uniref:Flagellar protein n=1 Tax=Stenotrophomonas maltophilia TaxID=40324 RepID=A0AAP7GPI4_STEMA|nr:MULTISPECIES: flagellar biosynthetic protein FliO [Stenotrophomonas]KOQ68223.1 flagellar protein [Stenotrophomonas maltophilia]MBA0219963.1 flagellar biosynthetic protein FliO [Stenotrophomonas maltophilia]MBE5271276.1 flagellar biosynthetic protein FliO [Stenotrophomonas sp. B2]MBH1664749.1 flagellar biosynthetic protein FliO [Stenotrophomonas maltophilia]MBN4938576.1 flagellar biosynthetic protein FliO [Stenotrophomonas maltophilia]